MNILKVIFKYLHLLLIVVIVFTCCFCIIWEYKVDLKDIIGNQFLISYLGVLLGFALTLFTFIIAMVEKISEKLMKDNELTIQEKTTKQIMINSTLEEVKDDIKFVFISLLICCFLAIIESFDIPYIDFSAYRDYFTKISVINSLKLTIFLLSFYAIYDIMMVSFIISELTSMIIPKKTS